jgi:hypothetical protein
MRRFAAGKVFIGFWPDSAEMGFHCAIVIECAVLQRQVTGG